MLLVTDLLPGGTPLRLARLARGLRSAGVVVHVGCLAGPGPVSDMLAGWGIPTFACHARRWRPIRALRRLNMHVRLICPDLIHATLTHANVAARIVGRWRRVPVIGSTATIEVERRGHLLAERATAFLDAAHIVNSQAVAEHVMRRFGLPRSRIVVVPPSIEYAGETPAPPLQMGLPEATGEMPAPPLQAGSPEEGRGGGAMTTPPEQQGRAGVSPADSSGGGAPARGATGCEGRAAARRVLGLPADAFIVLWVGRFDPVKRVEWLIEAAERIGEVGVHFVLVGDGPHRAVIERRLAASPARSRVMLAGWQEDVGPYYAAADAFALVSRTEGMPNAALQAMASGLPVIASAIPAMRELAGDEQRVLLLPRDGADALAEQILRLRDDPALRQQLGEAARRWAATSLDPAETVRAVIGVYERVLGWAGSL